MMVKEKTKHYKLNYKKKYTKERNIIKENYSKLFSIIKDVWGLSEPKSINIYILKSDFKFILHTYPLTNILFIVLFYPYWYFTINKERKNIAGSVHFKQEKGYILVKPVQNGKNNLIGRAIFKDEIDNRKKFLINFTSLLTNCFSYLLRFPFWISKGISCLTADNLIEEQVINSKTLEIFHNNIVIKEVKKNYCSLNEDTIFLYNYVKGYWTVRYLEENYPGFLKETFKKYKGEEIVEQIILKLGLDSDNYWEQLDELLYENYKHWLEK